MVVEIDQSGRIEDTIKPTVLALSNEVAYSIRISAVEKRYVLEAVRRLHPRWGRTLSRVFVFSTLTAILLKSHIRRSTQVIIDPEYSGYEPLIKERILALCQKWGIALQRDQIGFRQIGKKSPAHHLAINTFRGLISPDREIKAQEVIRQF